MSMEQLEKYSFKPRMFHQGGSTAWTQRAANERSLDFAPTRASELRQTKSKESIRRIEEVEEERKLKLVQEQTPKAPEPAAPKIQKVSESLYPAPAKKRELAQIPERRAGPSTVLESTGGGFSRRAIKPAKKKAPSTHSQQALLPPQKKKPAQPAAKKPKLRETGKVYYSINSKLETDQPLEAT